MIMKPRISAIQLACAATFICLCQTTALGGVLISGGNTITSADDLTTSLRFDISAGGGPVNTEIFAPPFELPSFPNTRIGVTSSAVNSLT